MLKFVTCVSKITVKVLDIMRLSDPWWSQDPRRSCVESSDNGNHRLRTGWLSKIQAKTLFFEKSLYFSGSPQPHWCFCCSRRYTTHESSLRTFCQKWINHDTLPEVLQLMYRDSSTSGADIIGPYFARNSGCTWAELVALVYREGVKFFHSIGLHIASVIFLMHNTSLLNKWDHMWWRNSWLSLSILKIKSWCVFWANTKMVRKILESHWGEGNADVGENPWIPHPFAPCTHKLIFSFDPVHIFKCFRNWLYNSRANSPTKACFLNDTGKIHDLGNPIYHQMVWDHIKQAFESNKNAVKFISCPGICKRWTVLSCWKNFTTSQMQLWIWLSGPKCLSTLFWR